MENVKACGVHVLVELFGLGEREQWVGGPQRDNAYLQVFPSKMKAEFSNPAF